jgi:hypothetical protein
MKNDANGSRTPLIRRLIISAAAIGVAASVPAPAFADGGRHGRHYQPRHYSYGYHHPRYRNYAYYDYHRHRGHISGGEAALIAAGIIGGVILIDRALDNRDRYDDRYYSDRRYDDRSRRGAFDDDYYYQRDDRPYEGRRADWDYDGRDFSDSRSRERLSNAREDLDDELLGDNGRGGRPTVLADAAFRECVAETRGAAGAGGMNVAMPGAPTEVERLADGSVRMTAQFRASNARGETWTRRFVCETDDQGVRFLQVD